MGIEESTFIWDALVDAAAVVGCAEGGSSLRYVFEKGCEESIRYRGQDENHTGASSEIISQFISLIPAT